MKIFLFLLKLASVLVFLGISTLLGLYAYAQFYGPVGPVPGAELSGQFADSDPDWALLLPKGKFIEVQFSDEDPYSVTLDPHVVDGELYTWSRSENSWSRRIQENPRTIVRIDDILYRTVASRVAEKKLLAEVNRDRTGVAEPIGVSFLLELDSH